MDTYFDEDGLERCDECDEEASTCYCYCGGCGDLKIECACEDEGN